MYFVIVGAGTIGASLARWLVASGHEVSVVDSDEARCAAIEDELGSVSVVGDGTEAGTLAKAGVGRANAIIATTARDDVNLAACQIARHTFGTARAVSIVNVPERERLFRILGVSVPISATDLIVRKMQEEMGALIIEEIEEEVRNL